MMARRKQAKKEAFYRLAEEIIKKLVIMLGVYGGDFAEARWCERGMSTLGDVVKFGELRVWLMMKLGLRRMEFNMGNHESGYDLPLCTDPERGVNEDAIRNFQEFSGWKLPYYHSFLVGRTKMIFVPYFMTEKAAWDFDLDAFKGEFLFCLHRDLEKDDFDKAVLFVHDPDSFLNERLLEIMRENFDKIGRIFIGHRHSESNLRTDKLLCSIYNRRALRPVSWLISGLLAVLKMDATIFGKMAEYYRMRENIPQLIFGLGMVLIPSPESGRFLVLDTKTLEVETYES